MASLPESIHERLASEYKAAAARVSEATTLDAKLYYFSVFFGEATRMLNMHWDADLALLWAVTQHASNAILGRQSQAAGEFPLGGFPDGFAEALAQVSTEIAGAFEQKELDLPRLYAALARTAELTFATTGNGAYLVEKGTIKL